MKDYDWLGTVLGMLGGGGVASLITVLIQKRKTNNDIASQNIETARQLRDDAIAEYNSISEKLEQCRVLLNEAQDQMIVAKNYINCLCEILEKNSIDYPPKPKEIFGKAK